MSKKDIPQKKLFDPNIPFFDLIPVRLTAGIVALLAVACAISIYWFSEELNWNFSFNGWNNLFTVFKFPLAILATLIPLGALYAANHRSEQSRHLAILAESQNKFSNYYKHVEEFTKYLESYPLVKNGKLSLKGARIIHHRLYGERRDCDLTLKDWVISEPASALESIILGWKLLEFRVKGEADLSNEDLSLYTSDDEVSKKISSGHRIFSDLFADCVKIESSQQAASLIDVWIGKYLSKHASQQDQDSKQNYRVELKRFGISSVYAEFLAYATVFDGPCPLIQDVVRKMDKSLKIR